jgi:hypothetical protein
MPNGHPGDSVHHDIVHHGREIFGPTCDALVREITAKLPLERLSTFQHLIETWPWEPDGRPSDVDGLYRRLLAWRDEAAEAPRSSVPAFGRMSAASPSPRNTLGRALLGLLGFLLGATVSALVTLVGGALVMEGSSPGDRAVGDAITLVFFAIPLVGMAGGVASAVLLLRLARR